ncbi:hypothetical protein PVK06_045560 [Gossypium arboreum]|uniref:Uncharacterized protein n=1 Tax=Gossypium arboreum TaxID=29729 RepID=A0ABR0MUF0_GOSAR|nr:hypothetical protein PVK06_045560 [Gossypium arboreum]
MCLTSSVVTTMTSHLILALALLLLADGLAGCGFSNPACIGSSDHSHSSPYFKQRWLELCLGLVSLRPKNRTNWPSKAQQKKPAPAAEEREKQMWTRTRDFHTKDIKLGHNNQVSGSKLLLADSVTISQPS